MITTEKSVSAPDDKNIPAGGDGKLDPIVGRIDLLAVLTAALGVCLLLVVTAVMALFEVARLISTLWADSFDRWLLVVLAVAILWVVVRWKKLCVF